MGCELQKPTLAYLGFTGTLMVEKPENKAGGRSHPGSVQGQRRRPRGNRLAEQSGRLWPHVRWSCAQEAPYSPEGAVGTEPGQGKSSPWSLQSFGSEAGGH